MNGDQVPRVLLQGLSDTRAEQNGYLAATQTRDGRLQLISSRNHYVFNLAWLKALPAGPSFRLAIESVWEALGCPHQSAIH
jgi:hypothetical protein